MMDDAQGMVEESILRQHQYNEQSMCAFTLDQESLPKHTDIDIRTHIYVSIHIYMKYHSLLAMFMFLALMWWLMMN